QTRGTPTGRRASGAATPPPPRASAPPDILLPITTLRDRGGADVEHRVEWARARGTGRARRPAAGRARAGRDAAHTAHLAAGHVLGADAPERSGVRPRRAGLRPGRPRPGQPRRSRRSR